MTPESSKQAPLAYRMRPQKLDSVVGQAKLLGQGKPLRVMLEKGILPTSMILWGPPGCGKTTLAQLMADLGGYEYIEMSAVNAGKKDILAAASRQQLFQKKILLFLDEIHRFNKAQQDALLPYVEKGVITLVGATTENPSFEVNSALLSRSRVFVLERLNLLNLKELLDSALTDTENGLGKLDLKITDSEKTLIANLAKGDARSCFNILELAASLAVDGLISKEVIESAVQQTHLHYDKNGEEHYNIISALHKSMRDSDVDASVYWCMRMVEAGEDPKYIVRRMIRFASEDVGNSDPQALIVANAAREAVMFLGYPECNTALVQCAVYLAKAPKSNAVYLAVQRAQKLICETGALPVPLVIRNAPTGLMKELGYGKGYLYAHNNANRAAMQQHLPDELEDKKKKGTWDRLYDEK
tara:strand:- start:1464 stop:2705 length:1242 start_codon:yes stop_codon:yes gene_type:complete